MYNPINGLRTSMSDASGTTIYGYNSRNQLIHPVGETA